MNTKNIRRKRAPIKQTAPAEAKDVETLRRELAAQRRILNNLEKSNKYLRDRVSTLENRSNATDRILGQVQNAVNRFLRILN